MIHIIPHDDSENDRLSLEKSFELQGKNGNIATIKIPQKGDRVDQIFLSNLIKYMNDEDDSEDPIVLFGNAKLLMEMNEDIEISKIFAMYFRHYEEQPIPRKDCLLLGNYFAAISHIWGYDVKKEFDKEPTCDFSIIIPVRNSIKYLREVIETCLNQDYEGTYEILISDNGWHMGVDVLGLIKSINSEKIRYIKTPFDLSLTKSFEFAYLNARGKYLISLGSDDGMIKNSLSMITLALNKFPQNNIVMWPRARYKWPISNVGKQKGNKLSYNFGELNYFDIKEIDPKPLIKKAIIGKLSVFETPNMYLATCIKREHIGKIIGLTGKFEDGDSQDVYTGVLNLFIEDKITYLQYPVIISGGSEVGVGFMYASKPESLKIINNLFKIKFMYHRYTNYYNAAYREISPVVGMGNEYLFFREYKKIERYNFLTVDSSNNDILEMLHSIYYDINKKKLIDKNIYNKQLNTLAQLDEKLYKDYRRNRNKWRIHLYLVKTGKEIFHGVRRRLILKKFYLIIAHFEALRKKLPCLTKVEQWLDVNSGIYIDSENKFGILHASNFLYSLITMRIK